MSPFTLVMCVFNLTFVTDMKGFRSTPVPVDTICFFISRA